MSICKNCSHYIVCGYVEDKVKECNQYIGKEMVIKLPCPMFQTVYMIIEKRPKHNFPLFRFIKESKLTFYNLERVLGDINKTVFLTRAEAEQKIKELNDEN